MFHVHFCMQLLEASFVFVCSSCYPLTLSEREMVKMSATKLIKRPKRAQKIFHIHLPTSSGGATVHKIVKCETTRIPMPFAIKNEKCMLNKWKSPSRAVLDLKVSSTMNIYIYIMSPSKNTFTFLRSLVIFHKCEINRYIPD